MVKQNSSGIFLKTSVVISLLLMSFLAPCGFAQPAAVPAAIPALPQSQLKIYFAPVMYNRLELRQQAGEQLLHSRNTFSGIAGLGYYKQIKDTWGINLMAELTVVPQNIRVPYSIQFDTTSNTASLKDSKFADLNDYSYIHFMYMYSASLEKIIIRSARACYSIEAGVTYNRLSAFPYETSFHTGVYINNSTSYDIFDFRLSNYDQRHLISYFAKAGVLKFVKKKADPDRSNTLQLNIIGSYSPQSIGKGWYRFYNFDFENYGTAELGLNYIGLELVYGITLNRGK